MSFYRDYHDKTALEAWNERELAPYETIRVTPIAPALGAEIDGVDLTKEIPAEQLAEIRRASAERLVLVFRNQRLGVDDHKRFARHFGRLHEHVLASSSLIAGASVDPAAPAEAGRGLPLKPGRESCLFKLLHGGSLAESGPAKILGPPLSRPRRPTLSAASRGRVSPGS